MKFLVILLPAIVILILCRIKSEYRYKLTILFAVYVIGMNVFYNARIMPSLISLKHPVNQVIYQDEYADTLEYPDAFLGLLLDGKTVYTKDDVIRLDEAMSTGYNWIYAYYHVTNPVAFLEHSGATVIKDAGYNDVIVDGSRNGEFTHIGYANDMLRNVSIYSPHNEEVGNYFYHQWYYTHYDDGFKLYVCYDGLADSDEYVFLWQDAGGGMIEDFYLMTKDYYDRSFK